MLVEKCTVENLLQTIKSGIGLDIAKNHTGVFVWYGGKIEEHGFALPEYDKSDPHAECRMRRALRHYLEPIVKGRHFEHCIVEDVYGGDNFDTTRKLLALNTVIDDLIFDGVCTVDNFYRWKESQWLSNFRLFYRQKGRWKSKIETQNILEYLEYQFYLDHKDDTNAEKKRIFFEDICDACGQLLSVVGYLYLRDKTEHKVTVKMSDVKLCYIEDMDDFDVAKDKRVREDDCLVLDYSGRDVEKFILNMVGVYPNDLLCIELPVSKLGAFGLKYKLPFYESGMGYLYFYKR